MNNILNRNISRICDIYHNLNQNSIHINDSIKKIQEIIDKTGFYFRFKKETNSLIDNIYEFIQEKSRKKTEKFNVDFLKQNITVERNIRKDSILHKIFVESKGCFEFYIKEGNTRYSYLKSFNFLTDSGCIEEGYNFIYIFILFIENLSKKLECRVIVLEDQSYFHKINDKPYNRSLQENQKPGNYYGSNQEPSFYLKSIIEEDKDIEYLLYTKFIYGLTKFKTFYQEQFNFYTVYIDIYTHILNITYYVEDSKEIEGMETKSKLILNFLMELKSKIIKICVENILVNIDNQTIFLSNRNEMESNFNRPLSSLVMKNKRKIVGKSDSHGKRTKTNDGSIVREENTLYNFLKNMNDNRDKTVQDYEQLNKIFSLLFIYKNNKLIRIEDIDTTRLEDVKYVMTIVGNIYYNEFLKPYIEDKIRTAQKDMNVQKDRIVQKNMIVQKDRTVDNISSSNNHENNLIGSMLERMYKIDDYSLLSKFDSILKEENIVIDDHLRLLKVILISWNTFSSQTFKFL